MFGCGNRPTAIERAFELARSGEFADISQLRIKLSSEGYVNTRHLLDPPVLRRQLRELCTEARKVRSKTA